MARFKALVLAGLVLAFPAALLAGDPPAGNWKVIWMTREGAQTPWVIKLESKGGKWVGSLVAQDAEAPKVTIEDVILDRDVLRFAFRVNKDAVLRFEQRLPKEKDAKLRGSVLLPNRQVYPVHLEPTTLTSLEPFEMDKDLVANESGTIEVVKAAKTLLENASGQKAKPEEVRAWADKAARSAAAYGPLLHRNTLLEIVGILRKQKAYLPVALQYARQAERLLEDKDSIEVKKFVLGMLADVLEKSGKSDEAKEVQARNDKIRYVATRLFPGRKARSDRAVLVELFTGAECPPCVAADLAFDALNLTYKPGEVILLQHHLHVPGPDPLTNRDTEDRAGYYGEVVPGTPTILFNGKTGPRGGGSFDEAQDRYTKYTELIDGLLEKPAKATVKATASRKGSKIDIRAEVADLEEPGKDVRLYLALVEDQVSYMGRNKLPTHHYVVRAWPAGKEGVSLKEKAVVKSVTIDLDDLRKKLTEYLDKVEKDTPFPSEDRPMEMKRLRVVAFVQNDATKEVYQAAQAEVVQVE